MKSLDEIREIIRQHRNVIADKYGVDVVGIFGSYVRSEQERQSDIDLLAEILRPISLLEMVGAEIYLSETLGIKVDLVPKRSVREELRDNILEETVSI
jgi:predicted nucleotidyltransferase